MSNIKYDRGLSYTIPLDNMDLNYLNKYGSTPSSGVIPLWTKTRLDGETGYCQVQILTQNDEECYSEPTDTYECHICNVHVPVTCSKEHNDSEQHKTFKNIYQKVLEKLSKQIDMTTVKHDEKIDKDAYYCVPCSKIIKKENKDNHESSDFHAKSNRDTMIISEFYKIIREDSSHNDDIVLIEERFDEDSDLEPVDTPSCIENNNYAITISKLNNNCLDSYSDDSRDSPAYANILAEPGTSKNDNKIQPTNDETTETFEEYLKAAIKKYKLKVNLPMMMSDEIWIESSNGDIVTVSREHFQSYKQAKNSIYCQLCKIWISQDTKPHDITENHVRNIFKPINEKLARTIDSVSSHCVPCNDVVLTDSTHHTSDENHKKIVKDTRVQKLGQTYCEDCNIYIDTHNFAVHIISKKHLNSIMIQNSINKTDNPNIFFCKLCKKTLSKNGITHHVIARKHLINKTNDATKLSKNGATDLGNQNTDTSKINDKNTKTAKRNDKNTGSTASEFCKICKVDVPMGGMDTHVGGKAHKIKIKKLNKKYIKSKENKAQNSNGCSTSTSTTKNESLASISTSSSISNATNIPDDKIDEYYELLEFTNDRTVVQCKICLVYIAYVETLIIDHMQSQIHVEMVTKQKMDVYNNFLRYTDDEKTRVNCEICYVNVPKVDRNIIEHMEGRNHDTAVTGLLKFNLMTKESSGYVCECCEIHTTDYLEHINSKSHTNTFLQKHEIDKIEMRRYVYEDDIDDMVACRHRARYWNLLKHNSIYKLNDTNYYCGMCQIKLGRISELDHVLGERHALKLAEIENLITNAYTRYDDDDDDESLITSHPI